MMVDHIEHDLGLTLGLATSTHDHYNPWTVCLKQIDVNRPPTTYTDEEEATTSSPKSTLSSIMSGGKRSSEDEEDGADGSRNNKKLRLSKDQSAVLEESFKDHNTLNPKQKVALAKKLNLQPRQVEVWFQNRRARTKLKQTEVDCEMLKKYCESLTEENRRLQKEVQELRALKMSPHLYTHMAPPTTLTMCTSCERLASSGSATSAQKQQQRGPPGAVAPAMWGPIPIPATLLSQRS